MEHRKTFDVVRFYDPAIDWRSTPVEPVDYARDRDLTKLVMRAGCEPILFRYQRLTRRQWLSWVSRASSDEERHVRAFSAGVCEVVIDGRVWRPGDADRPDFVAMSEADLDQLESAYGIGYADLQEIGSVVLTRSQLPFGFAPRYPVLPSSVAVWVAASRLSAERSATGAAPSSTRAAEASEAQETSPAASASSSASRSGARATGARTSKRGKRS